MDDGLIEISSDAQNHHGIEEKEFSWKCTQSNSQKDKFGAQNEKIEERDDLSQKPVMVSVANNSVVHEKEQQTGNTILRNDNHTDEKNQLMTSVEEKKLSLHSFQQCISKKKKIGFVPPPPAPKFVPSSKLMSVTKAFDSPVWEFKSIATSSKPKRRLGRSFLGMEDEKSNEKKVKTNSALSQIRPGRMRTRFQSRISSRSRMSKGDCSSIPRTIICSSNAQKNNHGDESNELSDPGSNDSSMYELSSRKRKLDGVNNNNNNEGKSNKVSGGGGGSNGSSSKRSRSY